MCELQIARPSLDHRLIISGAALAYLWLIFGQHPHLTASYGYYLSSPKPWSSFCRAFRVNSPARRLARIKPGLAACKARPAASPAFFCTAGLRAACITAPKISRRNSILWFSPRLTHKLWVQYWFFRGTNGTTWRNSTQRNLTA